MYFCEKYSYNNRPSTVLARIHEFKKCIKHYQANPGTREVAYLSVDDAIWNVEALFNYTYTYSEMLCSREAAYDSALYLPINHNDSVLMADLTMFYERMYGAVSTIYLRDTLPNSQLLLLDVEPNEILNEQIKITLHILIGSVTGTAPTPTEPPYPWPGPFEEGEWWYYGENAGGSGNSNSDAAQELTRWLNYYLIPHAPNGYYYFYTDIVQEESQNPLDHPFENGYCEFYKSNSLGLNQDDLILDSDELNFHFFGEKDLVQNQLYTESPGISTTRSLSRVYVIDNHEKTGETYITIKHGTTAWYGDRLTVYHELGQERGSLEP